LIEKLTQKAESVADQRNLKRLYEITRTISGKNNKPSCPVKDKNSNIISVKEQRTRWTEHFKKYLTNQRTRSAKYSISN
jgi:hypothetical protein